MSCKTLQNVALTISNQTVQLELSIDEGLEQYNVSFDIVEPFLEKVGAIVLFYRDDKCLFCSTGKHQQSLLNEFFGTNVYEREQRNVGETYFEGYRVYDEGDCKHRQCFCSADFDACGADTETGGLKKVIEFKFSQEWSDVGLNAFIELVPLFIRFYAYNYNNENNKLTLSINDVKLLNVSL